MLDYDSGLGVYTDFQFHVLKCL